MIFPKALMQLLLLMQQSLRKLKNHSIKLLRSNFAKSGVMLNDFSTSKPEDIADSSYNLGKTLIDLSQTGKMKDHYP